MRVQPGQLGGGGIRLLINDLFLRNARLPEVEAALDELWTRVAAATGARLSLFTLADSFTGRTAPLRPLFAGFADAVRRVPPSATTPSSPNSGTTRATAGLALGRSHPPDHGRARGGRRRDR